MPGTELRRDFGYSQRVGPVDLVAVSPSDAAHHICSMAEADRDTGAHIHLCNAYTVALADKDQNFARTLSNESINLPDGKPVSWVSRIRRDDVPLKQVRGPQLFLDVFDTGRSYGVRHFLLGSTDEVLDKLTIQITARYPGAEIVGALSPPFRSPSVEEIAAQDETIRASGAQIVWVGLGTPKQDFEARRIAESLPVVAIAVGAAFDFAAGTVREAPHVFRKLGLEWTYRFAMEPRRLWRRYVFGNGRFIAAAIRHGNPSANRPAIT